MNTDATHVPATTNGNPPVVLPPTASTATDASPLLLNAKETAKLIRIGMTKFWRLQSTGAMPKPNHIGLFSRKEIEKWIADGCPDLRKQARARR